MGIPGFKADEFVKRNTRARQLKQVSGATRNLVLLRLVRTGLPRRPALALVVGATWLAIQAGLFERSSPRREPTPGAVTKEMIEYLGSLRLGKPGVLPSADASEATRTMPQPQGRPNADPKSGPVILPRVIPKAQPLKTPEAAEIIRRVIKELPDEQEQRVEKWFERRKFRRGSFRNPRG